MKEGSVMSRKQVKLMLKTMIAWVLILGIMNLNVYAAHPLPAATTSKADTKHKKIEDFLQSVQGKELLAIYGLKETEVAERLAQLTDEDLNVFMKHPVMLSPAGNGVEPWVWWVVVSIGLTVGLIVLLVYLNQEIYDY